MLIRKYFLSAANALIFILIVAGCNRSGNPGGSVVNGYPKMHALPFQQIRLEGELGTRYQAAMVNLLTHTDRYPPESFAADAAGRPGALWWDWPGDQIGRFLSCLHVAEGYGWSEAAATREMIAEKALPLLNPEGNFGPAGSSASDDVRLISGNAFCLRGFVDAYEDTHDKRFLEAAEKMARYFEAKAPLWETRSKGILHEYYGHCIDGFVRLYENTGQVWTLNLAKRLAIHAGRTSHTHHSLSMYRGIIDLARVSGDTAYLKPVKDYLKWCRENQTVTGGLPEAMPASYEDEGCGLADWIVVNLMMFELTGETRYFDDAEHTLVNHFFMNQFNTGGFGHLSFSQEIVGGKGWQGWEHKYGSENPGCCSLWGQWGLGKVGQFIVTEKPDTIYINLYAAAEIEIPAKYARLCMTSDFPRMSQATVKLRAEKPIRYDLALRKPVWAESMEILVNNKKITPLEKGGYLHITKRWKGTTEVRIRFVSGYRVIPWPVKNPIGVAIFNGPLCLGLADDRAAAGSTWTLVTDQAGVLQFDPSGRPLVMDSTGVKQPLLEPVGSRWLTPDTQDPVRRRILFKSSVSIR